MNYQDFFKELEGYSVNLTLKNLVNETRLNFSIQDFTIEDLYQAFEARLIDKLVVSGSSSIVCGRLVNKEELD